jgi:hypothetical protein
MKDSLQAISALETLVIVSWTPFFSHALQKKQAEEANQNLSESHAVVLSLKEQIADLQTVS